MIDVERLQIGNHSLGKLSQRLVLDPIEAIIQVRELLKSSEQIPFEEAAKMFYITKRRKGDVYLRFYWPKLNEHVLAIIINKKTVATFLTENIYASPFDGRRNNTSKIAERHIRDRILPENTDPDNIEKEG